MEFEEFAKIARLKRTVVVTEKIDGTNAQIAFDDAGKMWCGSRNRWITPDDDNFGFARWAYANEEELRKLGPGRHYGEWWGAGVGRRYDQSQKIFSLFNVGRWTMPGIVLPECARLVPVLYQGDFDTAAIDAVIKRLRKEGSQAAPGFMRPEGIILYHVAARMLFKQTLEKDDVPKSVQATDSLT
jgi:hypothetical protein